MFDVSLKFLLVHESNRRRNFVL